MTTDYLTTLTTVYYPIQIAPPLFIFLNKNEKKESKQIVIYSKPMPRKFTQTSYNYIQGWLKDKYKTDPEFRKKKDDDSRFYYLKGKVVRQLNAMTLDIIAEYYINHLF